MADQIKMNMDHKAVQSQKQQQRLIMLPQMQQAIQILQVPVLELASLVEAEMERNPILEYEDVTTPPAEESAWEPEDRDTPAEQEVQFDDQNFEILKQLDEDFREHFSQSENYSIKRTADEEKRLSFLESIVCEEETLIEHLTAQARESFEDIRDLKMAETLIGYLDENGFISTPIMEIALLHQYDEKALQNVVWSLQTFDPPGIAAASLQESLLLQLQRQEKGTTLAYAMIEQCYDDLLHNRIPVIAKRLGKSSSEISQIIDKDIAKLDLHPAGMFAHGPSQHIIPDVTIRKEGDTLIVETNDEPIPHFRVNKRYLRMLDDPTLSQETEEFIKQKLASAKWLMRTIDQRNDTVTRIAQSLATRQTEFFLNPDGKLVPLTMKVLAEELELHESTIARAVSNKYMNSPRGLLPLRSFFTNALETEKGEDISSNTARDMLQKIIDDENKKRPLSDDAIARLMNKQGIKCARRTVAKYRGELGLGNAQQRRQYA
ncbi:MAG: RNA polymerase factor sigma-54 [Chlamydiales bacterium]|nr:RNA polymerase factor sigma-54 [Chlamydiales bacterium]